MTNTPKEERDVLIAITSRSSIFDGVYISGELGMRKPELDFYQYVLRDIDLAAEQVVLIDDKCRNVRAAEACGMHGVVFHDYDALRRDLEVY
ncbi:Cytochrome P450 family protein [Aspergillus niger]|uniref:Cytochrome P450 family protein n=1 Tax=Aspergillus niger TaxID=5061 RepID=A0A505HUH0_ASPNG|nr:Cytochrome P450 family protein [Aspergillus niger]